MLGRHNFVQVCVYLHGCWMLVDGSEEDHQLVIDAQEAKDVALWHRDVQL